MKRLGASLKPSRHSDETSSNQLKKTEAQSVDMIDKLIYDMRTDWPLHHCCASEVVANF